MAETVGIVGVGLMGQAFAHHLLQSGFKVQGYDLDERRLAQLHEQGGAPVESPAAAARGARWLITSLPTSDIVKEVVLGASGVAESAAKGLILADTSTSRPEDSEKLGAELAKRGIRFLDACVSGTSAMAWKKDLIVIAGGTVEDFEAARPLFDGFARAAYRMGAVGSGAVTKLIINLILFGNRLALAEGLVMGMKAGMEGESLLKVLQDAACSSKTMIDKGPKMLKADFSPEGQVRTSLKDARLALEQGSRLGAPMLVTSLWTQLQQAAYQQGLADLDSSAFIEVLRGIAGLPKRT
ncbi:MAG: NAD(P)-dependent oxidoreductase [Betaproteobacteria bacterium]|jgi:2-hydroxy-3-oxopropionate reductase|nr:MAG: NAD(P)-dependent oxidoreductase [Betaproteobacteria bacterium]